MNNLLDTHITYLPNIGEIQLKRSDKAKRVTIKLKPMQSIAVVVPRHYSFDKAIDFVKSKADWIVTKRKNFQVLEQSYTFFDASTKFSTYRHELSIEKWKFPKLKTVIGNGKVRVYYPENLDVGSDPIQKFIRKALIETWKIEAHHYLPQRTAYFAQQFGFKTNDIRLKNALTRWGSCSSQNNINLNIHLMRLPLELSDYVILHELAHTVEKNHGAGFWMLLNKLTNGKAHLFDKQLKSYRIEIF